MVEKMCGGVGVVVGGGGVVERVKGNTQLGYISQRKHT